MRRCYCGNRSCLVRMPRPQERRLSPELWLQIRRPQRRRQATQRVNAFSGLCLITERRHCLIRMWPFRRSRNLFIGSQDAFDRGTVFLAAVFAGEAQLTNANRSFGQGAAGYGRYFATSYADYVIGDFMTESIYPTLFHQDPRYFRKGVGSGWSRLGYAAGQIC